MHFVVITGKSISTVAAGEIIRPANATVICYAFETEEAANTFRAILTPPRPGRRIQCVETGEIFDSATAAATALGCSHSTIVNHLNRPDLQRTVKGRTYKRIPDNTPQPPAQHTQSRIQCVETGEIFDTATQAAASVYASPSEMSHHLNGSRGVHTVRGYTFRRL